MVEENTAENGPEILIVEDSQVEAELLRRCLVRAGYRVIMAKNGEEGLKVVRERCPAVVLSDIRMPLLDGYELCRAIKQDERLWGTPVILLSVLSEAKDIIEAINVGADGYSIKPYNEDILLERIRGLLAVPARKKRAAESLEVEYDGRRHTIAADGQQMLNLLLSVYENTLSQNRELINIQSQISLLNESLDQKVRERTAALIAEEEKLERANRTLRTLSACNIALIHARSEEDLFANVCRHIVETGGFQLAWVEYPTPEAGKPLFGAHFGDEAMFRCHTDLATSPEHADRCLVSAAMRKGKVQVCHNLTDPPECAFSALREVGVKAILALPLSRSREVLGVLTIFATVADAFDEAQVKLAEELAGDLAYGIVTLRTAGERDRYLNQFTHAMKNTVAAIARTLEKRDPYTAGHQQRVAALSVAIGRELGLAENLLEGLYFGAMIHDIGKIAVPAEILCKPSKLTEIEFLLIKNHTEAGYEIMQEVEFPWPVARMIRQHHERLDGSGYPGGLKGDEIIIEARIIAVADVVEAMTSHRPYRVGLGIEAALAEITQGMGSRYQPEVVEACRRLFREKGFSFAE